MNVNININSQEVLDKYNSKLNKLAETMTPEFMEELETSLVSNARYEQLCHDIKEITEKDVWEDFNFRTGKIMGIMRVLCQNPKHRPALLKATGMNNTLVDLYYKYSGNLPYVDKDKSLNLGRPMDADKLRQLMPILATTLGILITPDDLKDINQERWNKLYANALARAEETSEFKKATPEVTYDE